MPRRGPVVHIEIDDARLTTAAQTNEAAPCGSGLAVYGLPQGLVIRPLYTTPAKAGVQFPSDAGGLPAFTHLDPGPRRDGV